MPVHGKKFGLPFKEPPHHAMPALPRVPQHWPGKMLHSQIGCPSKCVAPRTAVPKATVPAPHPANGVIPKGLGRAERCAKNSKTTTTPTTSHNSITQAKGAWKAMVG